MAKKILMLCGDFTEDYETMVPFQALSMLGYQVNPEAAELFMKDYGDVLDFVIGSIHNMEKDLDVYYYDFTKIDVAKMYEHYVDWLPGNLR